MYVSDNKLDMLYEQIDPALRRRINTEAKVDLKLASLTIKQADSPQATRMAKLRLVEHYIDTHHEVGTVQAPGQNYFRGSMPMQWGWLRIMNYRIDPVTVGNETRSTVPSTAFFKGRQGSDLVILAGSQHHVLGARPTEERGLFAFSSTPSIMAVIGEHISSLTELDEYWRTEERNRHSHYRTRVEAHEHGLEEAAAVRLSGPAQHLEFLAVPLLEGTVPVWGPGQDEPVHAILATPIYVAQVGPSNS
ncbi:DUF7019 family protein [Streptomyces broussonetiae]|uniref:DUF7019 family protein n=1 Tax=Streptomyces broussonetiae TaxID=2686304 RepID=UPI00131CFA31|nr:SAVMC3_10250 family protein [Streptomyces broussonetiae]